MNINMDVSQKHKVEEPTHSKIYATDQQTQNNSVYIKLKNIQTSHFIDY